MDGLAKQRTKDIDRQLQKEQRRKRNEVVLLMLGPGGSGKSTFCKQLKFFHMIEFTESEKEKFRWVVHTNLVDAICTLIENAFRLKLFPHSSSTSSSSSSSSSSTTALYKTANSIIKKFRGKKYSFKTQSFTKVENGNLLSEEIQIQGAFLRVWSCVDEKIGEEISQVWRDDRIKTLYDERSKQQITPQLDDSAGYYLNSIERIVKENYVPTDADIIHARVKTTSVVETTFSWEGTRFRVVDVGGQRGERKKWLPLFSSVTAVIFCVGLSDYDIPMEEDPSTNRMIDALDVFKQVANAKYLQKAPIILFLNKRDLFEEKLKKVDLSKCFPEYKGGANYEKAIKFIQGKFQDVYPQDKKLFVQTTIATDSKAITVVWNSVREIVVGKVIDESLPI